MLACFVLLNDVLACQSILLLLLLLLFLIIEAEKVAEVAKIQFTQKVSVTTLAQLVC